MVLQRLIEHIQGSDHYLRTQKQENKADSLGSSNSPEVCSINAKNGMNHPEPYSWTDVPSFKMQCLDPPYYLQMYNSNPLAAALFLLPGQ